MLCKKVDDLIENGKTLDIDTECLKTDTNCPINKNENTAKKNYSKGVLFGVWVVRENKKYKVKLERPVSA